MTSPFSDRLDRRTALKWLATAAASATLLPRGFAQASSTEPGVTIAGAYDGPGYGTDPDLLRDYAPGELWPLTFDDHQRRTAALLCGLIIPADADSPSAADLQVHDFIDEWISSPYPGQAGDRTTILAGLALLDQLATDRYQATFVALRIHQQARLCDDLAKLPPLSAEAEDQLAPADQVRRRAQRFFRRFRQLAASGYYTTPEGMKAVGYIGNVPLAAYPATPVAVLTKLGLA